MAAFIASQREAHGVPYAVSCRALGVSQSWFYKWKDGQLPVRAARRERLKAETARLFSEREGKEGSPRVAAALREDGWRVSENTVAGLMAEMGLAARRKKKRKGSTRPGKGRWRAPDLVRRKFAADGINRRWYGDGTEIKTAEGKLYLSVTWNHGGVAPRDCRSCPVVSPQAGEDGGPAGDGCGVVRQVAGSGAARAGG
ncbi:MAG TPA: IS3 family transposase [Trebonia sp.]|nr:IS3 family transposase [Trebonia sp.]